MAQMYSTSHPYFPEGVEILGYAPNTMPLPVLLASFGTVLGSVQASSLLIARIFNKQLSWGDQGLFLWFIQNAFLHCCFEAYYVFNHATIAGSQHLFAQLWKEYALSDSRYLTSDPFMLSVESITVLVWGPICLAAAVSIVLGPSKTSLRYPLQFIACLAHLYGVSLYYSTSLVEGAQGHVSYSRPEPIYFWLYFVGFNMPWVIVPSTVLFGTVRKISQAFATLEKIDAQLQKVGVSKEPATESKKTK